MSRLLALFGEQFARQFISESVTSLDHIILCMVPLGIITTILGAIRVAGPKWARAFIGRARENRAVPEIELMSSTSHEVCEVFNGNGVVRVMGTPKLMELILIPSEARENYVTCGIHNLKSACEGKHPFFKKTQFRLHPDTKGNGIHGISDEAASEEKTICVPHEDLDSVGNRKESWSISRKSIADRPFTHAGSFNSAPNLQLNLPRELRSVYHTVKELWVAAAVSAIIQILVLCASAMTTFLPHFDTAHNSPEYRYGFWLFMCGTLCLNLGMYLCSWVIDHSTNKMIWRRATRVQQFREEIKLPQESGLAARTNSQNITAVHEPSSNTAKEKVRESDEPEDGFHLFWLQQGHVVNDQKFEPGLIYGGVKYDINVAPD